MRATKMEYEKEITDLEARLKKLEERMGGIKVERFSAPHWEAYIVHGGEGPEFLHQVRDFNRFHAC